MRPIEKRVAAVEAKLTPPANASLRIFIPGRDGDVSAFRQRCRDEGARCFVVTFVRSDETTLH